MRYLLILLLILVGCQTPDGFDTCKNFCSAGGQGSVGVLYMGAGACLCENIYGIDAMEAMCRRWNPDNITDCVTQSDRAKAYLDLKINHTLD